MNVVNDLSFLSLITGATIPVQVYLYQGLCIKKCRTCSR